VPYIGSGFDLGGLLEGLTDGGTDFDLGNLTDSLGDAFGSTDFNLEDLLQGASTGADSSLSLDNLLPELQKALQSTSTESSSSNFDLLSLAPQLPAIDLDSSTPFI